MLRRITFRALPALVAAGLLFVVGASSIADAAVTAHKASGTTITVGASEFMFKLSRKSVSKPGAVTFVVKNNGTIEHNFAIDGKQTKLLKPGASTTLKVDFTKKGGFHYECTEPGHAGLGMRGTFKVL
jgi:uncharacterized cupredoxin-like copper-binding protein